MEISSLKKESKNKIYTARKFIRKLSNVQQEYFDELMVNLKTDGLTIDKNYENVLDWIYDYVFNCDEDITFDKYIEKWNVKK